MAACGHGDCRESRRIPCFDDAGNDNVDPDTGLGGLGPQAFGERVETRFGRRVDGFTGDTVRPAIDVTKQIAPWF